MYIDRDSYYIYQFFPKIGYILLTMYALLAYYEYHQCAIITRGLYIFYPIFEVHFFVFKDFFLENSVLMYG